MLIHHLRLPVFQNLCDHWVYYIRLSFLYINIFSALLLNRDSSNTQAKKPPCALNTLCVLTTAATRAHIWPVKYILVRMTAKIRKRYNQVPHLTQDTRWESNKNTIKHHKQEPWGQPCSSRWPHGRAAIIRHESMTTQDINNTNDPQKKYRLGNVSKIFYSSA